MKTCTKCKEEKELEKFGKSNRNKTGLNSWCKDCVKLRSRQNYTENKEVKKIKYQEYKTQRRSWYIDYKKTLSCVKCGENHEACLDFHHLNSKEKDFEIGGSIVSRNKEEILKEIEKCIVLCSNCHRKLHWEEKN